MRQFLCFDIEYWRSCGPFLSNKSQWSKIQSSFIVHHINYSNFFYFQWKNIPLGSVSTASASGHFDYLYACIYYELIVENFVVEIHHGHLHFFVPPFFLNFWFYRSYRIYTSYFSFLNWTWNFLLWTFGCRRKFLISDSCLSLDLLCHVAKFYFVVC